MTTEEKEMAIKLLLVLVLIKEAFSQDWSVAKPGCQEKCGSLKISYPFGIGEECAYDGAFVIYCNNSFKTPRPFLRSFYHDRYINLEVLNISVPDEEATFRLSYPITKDCMNSSDHVDQEIRLPDQFTFSDTENQFVAMGCNNIALLRHGDFTATACISLCNNSSLKRDNSCFGINCCKTSFQNPLSSYIQPSLNISGYGQACSEGPRYGFIVDKDWFGKLKDIYIVQTMETVPVVLSINYKKYPLCLQDDLVEVKYKCGTNALCYEGLCSCLEGFEGNPFLPKGCQDINECLRIPETMIKGHPCNQNCTNTLGSYTCSCKDGWDTAFGNDEYCRKTNLLQELAIILIAIYAGLGATLYTVGWLYKVVRRRKIHKLEQKFFKRNGGLLLHQQVSSSEGNVEKTKLFTSKELEKATDQYNVDRIVGQGGQGTVYKGMLTDGRIVAVKKSKIEDESKLEHFINEVIILSQINHRNIVKLYGCCLETEVPLLVYEFIPNGTLMQYIHEQNDYFPLTWDVRVRVATEIAGALCYLHSAASLPIYHRDIKSSNILLDDKYIAKVADFGTSRSVSVDKTHLTTRVQGTFGYFDPQYFQSSQFTDKSDVYSFGVVLVELLTGLKPILPARPDDEARSLAAFFLLAMQDNRILDILDSRITGEGGNEEMIAFANIAYKCLNSNGRKRPTMKQVLTELESIRYTNGSSSARENHDGDEIGINEPWVWDATSTSMNSTISHNITVEIEPLMC